MQRFPGPASNWKLSSLLTILFLMHSSCTPAERGNRKDTFPVTGQIVIDGEAPSSPVKVMCVNTRGIDETNPSISWAMTDENGNFSMSTYESGDGVPPGNYALTFFWGQLNLISNSYGGPDRLHGRYDKFEESPANFTVVDQPIDLKTIELTAKKQKNKK